MIKLTESIEMEFEIIRLGEFSSRRNKNMNKFESGRSNRNTLKGILIFKKFGSRDLDQSIKAMRDLYNLEQQSTHIYPENS